MEKRGAANPVTMFFIMLLLFLFAAVVVFIFMNLTAQMQITPI